MRETLYSWGRYPPHPQTARSCHWRSEIVHARDEIAAQHGDLLAFGNGRSYGDSCMAASDHVLHMRLLDHFIAADWESGLIRVEAGVTLEEVLAIAIPKGWFLPATPGTMFATVGGALANDVHGKNHHVRGTFGCHVPRFGLLRSDCAALICSARENAEIYAATIGGLGLTGIIEWVELQLTPIRCSLIDALDVRFGSLDEFFTLSAELDSKYEFTVSWIDCLSTGSSAGRGIYMAGNHALQGALAFEQRPKLAVPFTPPVSAINRVSLQLFNSAYYRVHRAGHHNRQTGYRSFFYPLDHILNWNRIYGKRGFQQFQCAVPQAGAELAIGEMLDAIAAARSGSFLAVLKRFGDVRSPGLLSFPIPGVTLALDFSQQDELTTRLFARLDAIVRAARGRLYPAKDAHMSGEDFRAFYPNWEQLEALRDPVLLSRFWLRATQT